MIYQKMQFTLSVEWLDPENVDKKKRREMVAERLMKLFTHEFGIYAVERHGVKMEIVAVDGVGVVSDREIKEPKEVSSSDNIR